MSLKYAAWFHHGILAVAFFCSVMAGVGFKAVVNYSEKRGEVVGISAAYLSLPIEALSEVRI